MPEHSKTSLKSKEKLNKISHDFMRAENIRIVFECLRAGYANTKRGIQNYTKLSWGTVSITVSELLNRELVVYASSEDEAQKIGHPTTFYKINNRDNFIIGVDINVESLRIVVIDLAYNVLFSRYDLLVRQEKDYALEAVGRLIDEALAFIGPEKRVLAVGFAVMGAVDTERGIAIHSQHFKNWNNVKIKEIFEKKYNLPVIVEHDPNCLATAEMAIGKAGLFSNILILRLNLGIGMGIVINGKLFRGANGNAGEFGHICHDPDEPLCTCGHKGCIEAFASIRGIANRYRQSSANVQTLDVSNLYQDISIVQNLADSIRSGDDKGREYFTDAGKCLGQGISTAISLFNPDIVVLSGMLMKYSDLFMDALNNTVRETVWKHSPVNIIKSDLNEYAAAIGAAAAIINSAFYMKLFD